MDDIIHHVRPEIYFISQHGLLFSLPFSAERYPVYTSWATTRLILCNIFWLVKFEDCCDKDEMMIVILYEYRFDK